MKKIRIPKKLQGILWSSSVKDLDLEKNKHYIIHQILMYGSFSEIKWLFRQYSKKEIVAVFLQPYKNYPRVIYYFVKNYILGLKKERLDEQDYITSISGPVRPRAAGSI